MTTDGPGPTGIPNRITDAQLRQMQAELKEAIKVEMMRMREAERQLLLAQAERPQAAHCGRVRPGGVGRGRAADVATHDCIRVVGRG